MNWVALWHLCWVLFFLNVVTASDHESSLRPTSLRLPKQRRPLRSNNSIKKGSEGDFKSPDDPLSTTASALSRLSSKRTTNVDYVARNTVPVASATETIRKLNRPPPSHLLAYQALSTTERGSEKSSEASISPTGWALASLVPSKNATPPFPKRNVVVSGTAKPFNNYWSSRLGKPVQRTTPITPTDAASWLEKEKNHTDSAIPVENLIKDDNHTSNHDSSKHGHTEASTALHGSTFRPTEQVNYLVKPSYSETIKHTDGTTTSHHPSRKDHESTTALNHSTRKDRFENTTESHHRTRSSSRPSQHVSSDSTDIDQNTGNNLIKEVRGSDLGSSILNGIVLATSASKYAEEAKQGNVVVTSATNSTEDNTTSTITQKSPDEVNTGVAVVPDVTNQPDQQETASSAFTTSKSSGKGFTASSEAAITQNNVTTIPTTVTEEPSSESSTGTLGEIISSLSLSEVTNKVANLLENVISPTTPADTSTEVSTHASVTDNPESSTHPYSPSPSTESAFEIVNTTTKQMADNSTPDQNITPKTEPITTTLSNGLVEPRPLSEKRPSSSEVEKSPDIHATTLSQDVNDIPEAFTRVKDPTYLSGSSSQGTDNVLLPTSTLPPATAAKPQPKPLTSTTSSGIGMTTSLNIQNQDTPVTTIFSPSNTTRVDDNMFTSTTEMSVDTDAPKFTENEDNSSLSTTGKIDEVLEAVNETHTATMSTVVPVIHLTEDPRLEATTINSDMETSSESVERTTQILLNPSSHKTSTTNAPPTKPTTAETTPVHRTTTSTESHFATVVTERAHVPVDKSDPEDEHDDTLKYNVTITDISDKRSNTTDQEPDYNDSDKDEDENDKENEVPTTTTLVIIEEITTKMPSILPTTRLPITTTRETPITTLESAEDDEHHTTEVPASSNESELDQRLRLTFQASYKEMCLVRDSLTESIVALLKEAATRNIRPSQVKILNLGMTECSSKSLPLADKSPVVLHITDIEGRGDQNLTDLLYSYLKQGRLNFKYQVSNVEMGTKPFIVEEEEEWGGTVIAAIVVSSVAGVSLFCLTILLMIMRKRQKGFTSYGQRCTPVSLEDYSLDNISVFNSVRRKAMRASKRSYGNPAFDDPVTVTNPLNFVGLSNLANSHTKIDTEYSEVPTVTVKSDELPPGAECKNRYANVIPIPETRVPLMGSEKEDMFINANYVKGAKGAEKFYIACQAPLDSTIADFWMMIWEQQTQVILMLTDLHENGVEKCADYLPPSEVLDCHRVFGDLQVTLKKREVREKYVISSLQLRNLETNLWREVIHLWYTGWPIRGVPDDLTSIIAYLIEARSYSKPGHPIVVHCSPGTGRTGTVIAVDIAIRDFETDRIVDIPKTVYSIRRDRAGAVQTNLQYYLIYQVIHLYATKLAGGGLDSI